MNPKLWDLGLRVVFILELTSGKNDWKLAWLGAV
jgi:hypothetical protein